MFHHKFSQVDYLHVYLFPLSCSAYLTQYIPFWAGRMDDGPPDSPPLSKLQPRSREDRDREEVVKKCHQTCCYFMVLFKTFWKLVALQTYHPPRHSPNSNPGQEKTRKGGKTGCQTFIVLLWYIKGSQKHVCTPVCQKKK